LIDDTYQNHHRSSDAIETDKICSPHATGNIRWTNAWGELFIAMSKLSDSDAIEIHKFMASGGKTDEAAKRYSVSTTLIRMICTRRIRRHLDLPFIGQIPANKRFDDFIRINEITGCHEWLGKKNNKGYGMLGHEGKSKLSHRFAWERLHGKIPEGLCCLHKCDNPACNNPDHLFLGTHYENMMDRDAKNRGSLGSRNSMAKLDEDKVKVIDALLRSGMRVFEVAKETGSNPDMVHNILRGKTWTHVTGRPKHIVNSEK
jgi:hypothetical protein